jgi:hypothetical protein
MGLGANGITPQKGMNDVFSTPITSRPANVFSSSGRAIKATTSCGRCARSIARKKLRFGFNILHDDVLRRYSEQLKS